MIAASWAEACFLAAPPGRISRVDSEIRSLFSLQSESPSVFWHADLALSKLPADPFRDLGGLPKYLR